ncbi:uncharacterized protein LOC119090188 [Pollicipes pollicipes]|uniref:uncharacterized protein LOC119090188 n=1 Tax=Pollicipes pollicipes TaxID=41117 RepID=UPI001884DBC4|nr:uncharacterized protein LOC119090188 [Pollicipes pollicipes]
MEHTWKLGVSGGENDTNTLLVVHGIHPALSKEALRNQFIRFGDVVSTNVTINSRGNPMGFVQMQSVSDCAAAIAGLNGHAPLHWTVQPGAPHSERLRRRRERDEARRFEEEMRPIREAKLREFKQYEERMMMLTRELVATPDTDENHERLDELDAEVTEEPLMDSPADPSAVWPPADGQRPCSVCTAPTSGFCQRCSTPYCSSRCQSTDWDRHRHSCPGPV